MEGRPPVVAPAPAPVHLRLRTSWFSRPHHVIVDGPTTTLVLPRYLGRPWTVPTALVGVHDRTTAPVRSQDTLVAERPIRRVHLVTGSALQRPTTVLLLREPQRIPPVRPLTSRTTGIGWRESRSAEGVALDAVALAFRDPDAARRALVGAGAEPVADELAWWRRERATRSDPALGRDLDAAAGTAGRSMDVANLLLGVTLVLALVAASRDSWPLIGLFALSGAATIGALAGRRARLRRQVTAAQEAADRRGGFRSGP